MLNYDVTSIFFTIKYLSIKSITVPDLILHCAINKIITGFYVYKTVFKILTAQVFFCVRGTI